MSKWTRIERLLRETRFPWPYPPFFVVAVSAKEIVEGHALGSFEEHRALLHERIAQWVSDRAEEPRLHDYEAELEGLEVVLLVCLEHLAQAVPHGSFTRPLCGIIGGRDPVTGRLLMHVYDDTKLACLARRQGIQKAKVTLRQKVAELRMSVKELAMGLGCPQPALVGEKIPSRPGRAEGCPVWRARQAIWEIPPLLLGLYPELLRPRLESFVRSLIWASVRPWDAEGRRNRKFQHQIVSTLVDFEEHVESFCARELRGPPEVTAQVADRLRLIFQKMLQRALVERPDDDVSIVEEIEELCRLLGIDPRDLKANQ